MLPGRAAIVCHVEPGKIARSGETGRPTSRCAHKADPGFIPSKRERRWTVVCIAGDGGDLPGCASVAGMQYIHSLTARGGAFANEQPANLCVEKSDLAVTQNLVGDLCLLPGLASIIRAVDKGHSAAFHGHPRSRGGEEIGSGETGGGGAE